MAEFFRMDNPIQNYAWGSRSVLATMQGEPVPATSRRLNCGWAPTRAHPPALTWGSTLRVLRRSTRSALPAEDSRHRRAVVDPGAPFDPAGAGWLRAGQRTAMPLDSPPLAQLQGRPRQAGSCGRPHQHVAPCGATIGAELRELAHELRLDWLAWAANQPSALQAALTLSEDYARDASGRV